MSDEGCHIKGPHNPHTIVLQYIDVGVGGRGVPEYGECPGYGIVAELRKLPMYPINGVPGRPPFSAISLGEAIAVVGRDALYKEAPNLLELARLVEQYLRTPHKLYDVTTWLHEYDRIVASLPEAP